MSDAEAPQRTWLQWLGRGLRRWLRRLAIGLGVVLVLVLLTLAFVVFTDAGTRFALGRGIYIYDGMIPGVAKLERVEGSLRHGLTLHGVTLTDRDDGSLVQAGSLELVPDWSALVRGRIRVRRLAIHDVTVTLNGPWADLGPESEPDPDEPPPPPSPGFGPDMPHIAVGELEIGSATLLLAGQDQPLVEVGRLAVKAAGDGHDATVGIELEARLPGLGIDVRQLDIAAVWHDPIIALARLSLDSNVGRVELEHAEVDLTDLAGSLGRLDVDIAPAWLSSILPALPIGDVVGLKVHAHGRLNRLALTVDGQTSDGTILAVNVQAGIEDMRFADALVDVVCRNCGGTGRDVDVAIRGQWDLESEAGGAFVQVRAGELRVMASADLASLQDMHATVRWRSDALGDVSHYLAVADIEVPLSGRSAGGVVCDGGVKPLALACDVDAGVRGLAPIDAASVAARVELDDGEEPDAGIGVRVRLDHLTSAVHPFRVHTERTAEIAFRNGTLEVRDLAIAESHTDGHVRLAATVVPGERIEGTVHARRFDLQAVRALVPTLDLKGIVEADVSANTREGQLVAAARVRGRKLAFEGNRIGDLDLEAYLRERGVAAKLDVRGPLANVQFDASGPVTLSVEGKPTIGRGPIGTRLNVSGVELGDVGKFVQPWEGQGGVGVSVAVRGTLDAPRVQANVHGRGLTWGELALGDADVEAKYERGDASVRVHAQHPATPKAVVWARAPIALDLRQGKATWQREQPHAAAVVISDLSLPELGKIAKVEGLQGWADIDVEVEGRLRDPRAKLGVRAAKLGFDGHPLGRLDLEATLGEGKATLAIDARNPLVRKATVRAEGPLSVDALEGKPKWRPDEPHSLSLRLEEVSLEEGATWAPGLEAEGTLDVTVEAQGSATQPELTATLASRRAVVQDIPIEGLDLVIEGDNDEARIDLAALRGKIALETVARVPLQLDLPRGKVAWDQAGAHELRLSVVGIDRPSLAPLTELPETFDLEAGTRLVVTGNPDAFKLGWTARAQFGPAGDPQYLLDAVAQADERHQELRMSITDFDGERLTLAADADLDVNRAKQGQSIDDTRIATTLHVHDLDLAKLAELFPPILNEPAGIVGADVRVAGTIGKPELDGNLLVADGGLTPVMLRSRLRDIQLDVDFDNDSIQLRRLHLIAGRGSLDGEGKVGLGPQGVDAAIDLSFVEMPIRVPPLPSMEFSSDVDTRLAINDAGTDIDVKLKGSVLDVLSLSSAGAVAIPTSDAIVYVDAPPPVEPPKPDPEAAAKRPSLNASVELVDPISVAGPALSMAWDGKVDVDVGETVAVNGAFQADTAVSTFDLLGNNFRVTRGSVSLSEDVGAEPYIDLEARTRVGSTQVTVTISGRATRPEIRFSSSPPREETEIIAMLLSRTDDTQTDAAGSVAQAAAALSAFASPALSQQGQKIGLDSVRLSFGDSLDEPVASFGKRLSKRVYSEATFRGNPPTDKNRSEVMVRYRFLPRWIWETYYGDRQIGGTGVWWVTMFNDRINFAKLARESRKQRREDKERRAREQEKRKADKERRRALREKRKAASKD